jgi:histidinol-phosphate/aromatic aminotransferase/cobyric acid decarboxylase-like protein
LSGLDGVSVIPSEANFVLLDVSQAGAEPDEIVASLLDRGVLVRSLASHRAERKLVRITVGDEQQNLRCARAFEAVMKSSASVWSS